MTNTIHTHHDADGIAAAYMTSFAHPDSKIHIPEEFGDVSSWKDGDIMTDMRPVDPSIKGTVIDHHPGHAPIGTRKYTLHFFHKPATLGAWEMFKDKIPKDQWWKAMVGAVGDGQAEKVPYEIWNECKPLLKKYSTYVSKKRGTNSWSYGSYPIYQSLSSPVNAFCRVGKYDEIFDILKLVDTPLELIKHPEVIKQKKKNSSQFNGIMYGSQVLTLPNLRIVVYKSNSIRVTGWVASVLGNNDDTCIAINELNGHLSVRGVLSNYLKGLCKEHGLDYISFDGHDGFMGGRITEDPYKLYYDLMEIL